MQKKIVLGLILISTLGIGFLMWQPKKVESIQVSQGDIKQTIVATGRVAPMAKIELASLVSAQIERIHVNEGDIVSKGQLLITLSDASVDASVVQAQANLREAEERLQELSQLTRPLAESSLAQAKANLTLAQAEFQRYASLEQQKLASQSSLDAAKKTLDVNQKAYETALKQWQATQAKGTSSQLIQSRIEQAKAALNLALAKQAQLFIYAPSSGTLLQRLAEVGATVQPGKTLMTLASQGETRIEAPIDEKSMRFLATEQQARVIADAYPQQPFDAKLSLIYPSIDPNRATVNVRLIVDQPPAFLRSDMTVSIEMITGQAENVLIVPTDAIRDAKSNAPWVMKIVDNKTTKQPVTLGISGVGYTQILTGVAVNDWVVTQADTALNTRVMAKARLAATSK